MEVCDTKDFESLEEVAPDPLSIYDTCGTNGGYKKHQVSKTLACSPCKAAAAAYRKAWGDKNRERHNEISKNWVNNNIPKHRAKMREINRRRRAKKLQVQSEIYTEKSIVELYGSNCHICNEEIDLFAPRHPAVGEGWERGLQLDHVVPISKGGTDMISNIRPSHVLCNMKKGDKDYFVITAL